MKSFSSDKKKEKTEKNATFLFCSQNEREICDIVQRLLMGGSGEKKGLNTENIPAFTLVGL